jgi:hypothetical protein
MLSKRPLAMSFQLVIDERKRLAAEIEIVWDDGSTLFKRLDANERLTLHFEDLAKEKKSA